MISEWIPAFASGETIDGRKVTDDRVRKMAERYNVKTYEGGLNYEHWSSFQLGTIVAAKAGTMDIPNVGEKLALFVKIEPNSAGLSIMEDKYQKLYHSIEINPNFPYEDGKGDYLIGLAFTKTPASVGMPAVQNYFSANGEKLSCAEDWSEFSGFKQASSKNVEDDTNEEPPGWFKKFYNRFAEKNSDNTNEEDEMSPEQFATLTGTLEKVGSTLEKFGTKLDSMGNPKTEEPAGPDEQSEENYSKLMETLNGVNSKLSDIDGKFAVVGELKQQVAELQKYANIETNGQGAAPVTAPAGETGEEW